MTLSQVCVERLSPWTDESTAQWALAEIRRLDPQDQFGFKGKVSVYEIEIDIEKDRLREAVTRADEFLQSNPRHHLSGEIVVRKVYALGMLGEFTEGAEASHLVDSSLVDKEMVTQIEQNKVHFESLAKLKTACDQSQPDFESCVGLLQAIHDNPPKGFWVTYLRRTHQAKAPLKDQHLAMTFELGSALLAENPRTNRDEAKRYFEEIVNEETTDKNLRRRAKEILETLASGQP